MSQLPVIFHPDYVPEGLSHFDRLRAVADLVAQENLGVLIAPQPLAASGLQGLHDNAYVSAVLTGEMPLARSAYLPWSPGLVRSALLMLGGQLLGAQLAQTHGICINLACGFHHAHPARGGGFCIFNGLALVAHAFPALRVSVLDCDEHGGDGTEAFTQILPNLSATSLFGSRFGLRGTGKSRALRVPVGADIDVNALYLEVLEQAISEVLEEAPDLVLYQAGMDLHEHDPRATLKVSAHTLMRRDTLVLSSFKKAGIPVLVVMAGAYQSPDKVATLYRQTLHAANAVLPRITHTPR